MDKINIKNELTKRRYLQYLREAEGLSESTITGIEQAVNLFERFVKNLDFDSIKTKNIIEFKRWLSRREFRNKKISLKTYKSYLNYLKKFFLWLSIQPGYKSKIKRDIIEYFNLRKKENRIVTAQDQKVRYPSIEYCKELVSSIKGESEIDMRDRALIAFTCLTGMRDHAIVSLPLGCVDENELIVRQDPSEGVKTKFTKYIISKIFKIDKNLLDEVLKWIRYLKKKGFSLKDPLFPRSKDNQTNEVLTFQHPTEVVPIFWKTTNGIRAVFKYRSEQAGLEYFSPRALRHTAVYSVVRNAKNGRELKAVSQHFGHNDVRVTLQVYGNYSEEDLIEALSQIKFDDKHNTSLADIGDQLRQIREEIMKDRNAKKNSGPDI